MGYKGKHTPKKAGKKKRLVLAAVSVTLCAALVAGIFLIARGKGKPVSVYSFENIGMTEFWGDAQESYGSVTTDRIQTVFLSDTQIVTEVKVAQGDQVKKGDVLMCFDTTLSELELERKRLAVEKKKLDLDTAVKRLAELQSMEPMRIPDYIPPEPPDPEYGKHISEYSDYLVDIPKYTAVIPMDKRPVALSEKHDGSSPERAIICWLSTAEYEQGQHISLRLLPKIQEKVDEFRKEWAPKPPEPSQPRPPEPTQSPDPPQPSNPQPPQPSNPQPPDDSGGGEEGQSSSASAFPSVFLGQTIIPYSEGDGSVKPSGEDDTPPSGEGDTPPSGGEDGVPKTLYIVFKVTSGDKILAPRTLWQGLRVRFEADGQNMSFSFFDPVMEDYSLYGEETPEEPTQPTMPDFGGIYTAAELAKMRREQEKVIRQTELDVKMAEAEYKLMLREVNDGQIYADFDGEVVSLLPEEEARLNKAPMLKVSGGGGFYIQGSVSELEKDNLEIGQEVTVNDYRSGTTLTGTVTAIQDLPDGSDGWNGMNNPNSSYYPFTVFVDGSEDLQEGSYVNLSFSAGGQENGIYLENPFLRRDKGVAYVYVRGADGRLEKRQVVSGKSLWGSYTEILSGLSPEDFLAFPYGKDVRAGAPTQEGDVSELYS